MINIWIFGGFDRLAGVQVFSLNFFLLIKYNNS